MATSSKVTFTLEKLREEAVKVIDERITEKQLEVERHGDPATEAERIRQWRAHQEDRISALFRSLGEGGIDDLTLSRFKIDDMPRFDRYSRERAERELSSLRSKRGKIIAKSGALVADADGNIALTKTQLQEFFDL